MNEDIPTDEMPERKLFKAVVAQAMYDAFFVPVSKSSSIRERSRIRAARRDRDAARVWFEGNSQDYRLTCDLAGIDPEHMKRVYYQRKQGHSLPPLKEAA